MPTAPSAPLSNLGEIEERMRRSLALVGIIGARADVNAVPVILVDDATRPGTSNRRGRAWMGGNGVSLGLAGTTPSRSIQAVEEIVVDTIFLTVSANIQVNFRIAPATLAAPYAMTSGGVLLTERNLSVSEFAPVTTGGSTTVAANGGTAQSLFYLAGTYIIPVRIHLPVGGRLGVDTAALTGDFSVSFAGRIF